MYSLMLMGILFFDAYFFDPSPFRCQKPGALSISDQLDGKDLSLNLEAEELGTLGRTSEVSAVCQRIMNILHEHIEMASFSISWLYESVTGYLLNKSHECH